MFQEAFLSVVIKLTGKEPLAAQLWEDIAIRYSSPNRHYHNLHHLDNLLQEIAQVKHDISDWETMICSIAYHDIVYDATRGDNEETSASYAEQQLTKLGLPNTQIEKCCAQIIATKGHQYAEDMDTNIFTDADLSILGYEPKMYQAYAAAVRKEYGMYPDDVYNEGRKKVLNYFLSLPTIYKTEHFQAKYEQQAKENLLDEYNKLSFVQ